MIRSCRQHLLESAFEYGDEEVRKSHLPNQGVGRNEDTKEHNTKGGRSTVAVNLSLFFGFMQQDMETYFLAG